MIESLGIFFLSKKVDWRLESQQVWLWPYEAPGIIGSELYDITIVCGPKDMSLEK